MRMRNGPGSAAAAVATMWVVLVLCGAALAQVPGSPGMEKLRRAQDAYDRGVALQRQGRHEASVPYFRAALSLLPQNWQLHHDYALALHNAAFQTESGRPVTRSSVERVALLREALQELDVSQQLAGGAGESASALRTRGNLLRLWGFPVEALDCYERAIRRMPAWTHWARFTTTYRQTITRGGAGADSLE